MHPLDDWLERNNRTRSWLAAKVGTTEASLSRTISGKQWPGREFFARLAKITKGDVTSEHFVSERAAS